MEWLHVLLDVVLGLVLMLYFTLERCVLFFVPAEWRAKDVSGDVVLVTGGGSGLGRLVANLLAARGATVVVWDVNKEGNDETVQQIKSAGGKAFGYVCDISTPEEVYRVADQVKKEVGRVTILINNAGIVIGKSLLDLPDSGIQKVMSINSLAHFWTTKAFLPDMMERNYGHVVTIASLAGYFGQNRLTDYCASKFAAIGFDESLDQELRAGGYDGIRTTCVCPYYINTGMFDGVQSRVVPILKPETVARRIVNGILTNDEVVIIPHSLYIMILLKTMLPRKGLLALERVFRTDDAMATFSGRPTKKVD